MGRGVSPNDAASAAPNHLLAIGESLCHFSRVRYHLLLPLLLALFCAGCSTPMERFNKKLSKQEAGERKENSRRVERNRMLAAESGEAGSKRGAEILVLDKFKAFDPSRSAVGGRTYDAGKARTKDFQYQQKATADSYRTRDFRGSKNAATGDIKFATKDAATKGYATKDAATKNAPTKEAWDAGKTAATRGLHDGKREYLGPESTKLRQSVDPVTLGDWRSGGETVTNTGSSVEKYSTMKSLSIDDIRELLNKNK